MNQAPIPAPIYMSDNMQAGVPMAAPVPPPPIPPAVIERAADRRFGAKIKAAAFVTIAFWVLSSQPFFSIMNGVVCSFSLTAAPCVSEPGGPPTMKGLAIAGVILFLFTMYLLGSF